jgi:polysaccharide biosynthesis/export protein
MNTNPFLMKARVILLKLMLLGVTFLSFCHAQDSVGQPQPGNNLPAQPLGPADLIGISVYGAPEFTRTLRVSDEGRIRLPMLKDPVEARGLMPAELEVQIAQALERAGILVEPVVTVTIAEYHSRPISVAGAVKTPLTFQASGKVTLLEALTRAQGLAEDAGPEILLSRLGKPIERIPVDNLIRFADPASNIVLEGGEEIRVPRVGRIFVVGNVKKPGAFRAEDGAPMSVLKALALAEGLTPFAFKTAYIYRRGVLPDVPGHENRPVHDNSPTEVLVELRKIMDRKSPDVMLTANDVLYVPDHRSRRVTTTAIEKAIGFATGTASGALILGVNR